MAKSKFLQVRVTEEDKKRIERAARAHYIDTSTWARMTIMQGVDAWERRQGEMERGDDP